MEEPIETLEIEIPSDEEILNSLTDKDVMLAKATTYVEGNLALTSDEVENLKHQLESRIDNIERKKQSGVLSSYEEETLNLEQQKINACLEEMNKKGRGL
jgi:hypothetical protein